MTQSDQSESAVERIARAFHEAYEELAPEYGYLTREASRKPWEDVPHDNRSLMRATVGTLLSRGVIKPAFDEEQQR